MTVPPVFNAIFLPHPLRESPRFLLNPRHLQNGPWVVGGFRNGEAAGQDEVLVEIKGPQNLFRHDIPAAVARNHQTVYPLLAEVVCSEEGSQPVDHGGQVGAESVVVVGGNQHYRIALEDGGEDFLCHDSSVETVFFLPEVPAGLEGAATAVLDAAVPKGNLFDDGAFRKILSNHIPEKHGVGGFAGAGMNGGNVERFPGF